MADVFKPEVRSYTMSKIRKTNTKPEIVVRSFLFKNGFRFRIHVRKLPGNPDIVLPKYKTIIFVNGCFWHAHKGCKLNRMPKSNKEYWIPKIERNAARDLINKKELKKIGWRIITIWECELKNSKREKTLLRLLKSIKHEPI